LKGNIWTFSPKVPEEKKENGNSADANTESPIEINISKIEETKTPVSVSQPKEDFSADADEDNLSAFEEMSSAIENKSSARAIEK